MLPADLIDLLMGRAQLSSNKQTIVNLPSKKTIISSDEDEMMMVSKAKGAEAAVRK